MIHKTKKIKFKNGQDANAMLMRKLMYNFLRDSRITTTEAKAKALKTYMDRMVSKAKEKTEANKNYLLRYFNDQKIISVLFDQVGPAVSKINGGFVKTVRLNQRKNDATMMVQLLWAHPVVIDWGRSKPEPIKVEKPVKKAKKVEEPKKTK
jgi:large subunit ribosomal protein L17